MTVAGQLNGDAVPELERVVGSLAGPLRLDLAGLRSADEAGLGALRALRDRGVTLTGLSPFHRLMLSNTRAPGPATSRKQAPAADRSRREKPRGRRPG